MKTAMVNKNNILGDMIICPHCKKPMKLKKDTFYNRGCTVICEDCNFKREVIFPENVGGFVGELNNKNFKGH